MSNFHISFTLNWAWHFVSDLSHRWSKNGHTQSSAAISFYALFAIAPLIIFSLTIAGRMIGTERATEVAKKQMGDLMGARGVEALDLIVSQTATYNSSVTLTTVTTILMLLYGASYVFVFLRKALDRAFGCHPTTTRKRSSLIEYLIGRGVAIVFVVVAGVLLIALMVGGVLLEWIRQNWTILNGIPDIIYRALAIGISSLLTASIFTATFRFLPTYRPASRTIFTAVAIATPMFESGKWLFSLFVSNSTLASVYGSAGALVGLTIWIYYSSRVVLLAVEAAVCMQNK